MLLLLLRIGKAPICLFKRKAFSSLFLSIIEYFFKHSTPVKIKSTVAEENCVKREKYASLGSSVFALAGYENVV